MFGSPAAASKVGSMSWWQTMPFRVESSFDFAGPAHETRNAPRAFPVCVLLAAERCVGAIGPSVVLGAVVGGIHDDCVISNAQLIDLVQHFSDLLVVGHHPIAVVILPALATVLGSKVSPYVHRCRVVPEEERLVGLDLLLHPADSVCGDFLIHGFHPLLGERTAVLNNLFAYSAKAGINSRIILVRCKAMEHAARAEMLPECRVLGIVRQFRLLFSVQVIEVTEKFVKSMHGRQVFIAIAEMVLAELAGGVADGLQQVGDGRVFRREVRQERRAIRLWSSRCAAGSAQ